MVERFAFDLYDKDDSGTIDLEEAQHMVKDIYGVRFETNPRAKLAYSKLKELDLFSI
jgi:Ca2+-binding EF-hand superfamily protein